ncbi:MAG: hypothetical protein SFY80_11250 [Verrucomicrobiota bacterium]|nr:hypothetical protein [Verrucomicrobiota bacterium]
MAPGLSFGAKPSDPPPSSWPAIPGEQEIRQLQLEEYRQREKAEKERKQKEAEEAERQKEEQKAFESNLKEQERLAAAEAARLNQPIPPSLRTITVTVQLENGPKDYEVNVYGWPRRKGPGMQFKYGQEAFDSIPMTYGYLKGDGFILRTPPMVPFVLNPNPGAANLLFTLPDHPDVSLQFFQFKQFDFFPNLDIVNILGYGEGLKDRYRRNIKFIDENSYFLPVDRSVVNQPCRIVEYTLTTGPEKVLRVQDTILFINNTLLIIRFQAPVKEYDGFWRSARPLIYSMVPSTRFP